MYLHAGCLYFASDRRFFLGRWSEGCLMHGLYQFLAEFVIGCAVFEEIHSRFISLIKMAISND